MEHFAGRTGSIRSQVMPEIALRNEQPVIATRLAAAAGAGAMVAGSGVVAYFDPTTSGLFPLCPLYALTGFACPGCGLTRAFHALFHGEVLAALDFHALVPMFALFFGLGFLSLVYFSLRGRWLPVNLFHPTALWIGFGLLFVFGAVRNLPWYPFSVLFP